MNEFTLFCVFSCYFFENLQMAKCKRSSDALTTKRTPNLLNVSFFFSHEVIIYWGENVRKLGSRLEWYITRE